LIAVFVLVAACAAAAPDFSGTWKLNNAKSNYGQMPPPTSMTQTIKHADPKLSVAMKQVRDEGEFEWEANYTTDGKESTNEIMGSPMKSVAKWEGDALVIETKGNFGGGEMTIKSRWTLSADGKTLTVDQQMASSMGEMTMKMVMEKQ
jgi:hypothetical protein